MPRPNCLSCYYLGKGKDEDGNDIPVCRRNAPMPFGASTEDTAELTAWPRVMPDYDWCGDHHWQAESGAEWP